MASQGGFKPSALPPISDTGMRGFLKWLQREQPSVYKQVAVKLRNQAPQVFSDYTQSQLQTLRHRVGVQSLANRVSRMGKRYAVAGLGDDTPFTVANPAFSLDPTSVMDVSDAANNGAGTSTNVTDWVSNLVTSLTGAYSTVQQAQTTKAIVNLQLQRAQNGQSPLNIGMGANGIPIIGASLGGGSLVLVGAGLVAVYLFTRHRGARAA
jgi:hypothetical protein